METWLQDLPARSDSGDADRGESFRVRAGDHGKGGALSLCVYEVGIGYRGHTYEKGKRIRSKDDVQAICCVVKYSLKEPRKMASAKTPTWADQFPG
jgi:hypothetical protein